MKVLKNVLFFFPFFILLSSCLEDGKNFADIYYKSTFLGSDSFELKGSIFNRNGDTISGDSVIAKISSYDLNDWSIKGNINNNQFSVSINKTDSKSNSLPVKKNDDKYRYDTAWEVFTPYFSIPGCKYDERDKKIYRLDIYLDEYDNTYDNLLYEFIGNKPQKYFPYTIEYVYISEPIDISGKYRYEDEFWEYYCSFDCDFSKPGWYKIYTDVNPIGKNQAITSSQNTRYYKN